jgi:hypothetical protein
VRPEDGYTTPAQFAEILADVRAKHPRLLVVPSPTRAHADRVVHELLDEYALVDHPPHVTGPWRFRFDVYVYERRASSPGGTASARPMPVRP